MHFQRIQEASLKNWFKESQVFKPRFYLKIHFSNYRVSATIGLTTQLDFLYVFSSPSVVIQQCLSGKCPYILRGCYGYIEADLRQKGLKKIKADLLRICEMGGNG